MAERQEPARRLEADLGWHGAIVAEARAEVWQESLWRLGAVPTPAPSAFPRRLEQNQGARSERDGRAGSEL